MMSGVVAVHLIWPFVLVAIVWVLAVWAINQPDNQSLVVQRLTKPSHFKAAPPKSTHNQPCAGPADADA